LRREDLLERAGVVSAAKLGEIDDALRASRQQAEWTPATAARLSEIKDSLRRRTQAGAERVGEQDRDLRLEH
jgi:mRNA interferase MazF